MWSHHRSQIPLHYLPIRSQQASHCILDQRLHSFLCHIENETLTVTVRAGINASKSGFVFFEIKVQQLRPYLSHLGQIWTQLLNFWNKLWSGSFIGIEAICKIYLSFEIINVLKISYDILYDEN